MTLSALKKIVDKCVAQGCGRMKVCVEKPTFTHPLESDGVAILEVRNAEMATYPMADDDGGTAYKKSGEEVTRTSLVLRGK